MPSLPNFLWIFPSLNRYSEAGLQKCCKHYEKKSTIAVLVISAQSDPVWINLYTIFHGV